MSSQNGTNSHRQFSRRAFLALGGAALTQVIAQVESVEAARPARVIHRRVAGIPFYQTTIDLTDPKTFITIGLPHRAPTANSAHVSYGDEAFGRIVARSHAAVVANGTFFSTDGEKRVMGNVVAEGRFLKYSPWENYGTTLGLRAGNEPEMVTARVDGKPDWQEHWFSITSGPRLLKQGKVWLAPKSEGFRDPRVLGVASRAAIGFPRGGEKLVLVTFLANLSLEREAKIMRAIGCYEAMNLDGGSSLGLASHSKVLVRPGRELTNVIVVYDAKHPAPTALKNSWTMFQRGDRPTLRA